MFCTCAGLSVARTLLCTKGRSGNVVWKLACALESIELHVLALCTLQCNNLDVYESRVRVENVMVHGLTLHSID